MTEKEYQKFLSKVPENHFSRQFIKFLTDNNEVVSHENGWLVIKNKKYWNSKNDWLTAFYTREIASPKFNEELGTIDMIDVLLKFPGREYLIKAKSKRSIQLFHFHLYKK